MNLSITQDLMNKLYSISVDLGYNTVVDPRNIKGYPVVHVSRPDLQLSRTKFTLGGQYFVQINVWAKTQKDIGIITDELVLELMKDIKLSNGSNVHPDIETLNIRNLDELDNDLFRNLIELEYKHI